MFVKLNCVRNLPLAGYA